MYLVDPVLQRFAGGFEITFLFGFRCSRHRCLELVYVDGTRAVQLPAFGVVVRYKKRAFDRKRAAQVVDQLPQVRSRLRFARGVRGPGDIAVQH